MAWMPYLFKEEEAQYESGKRESNIPTDIDVIQETLDLSKRWGADAVRDCDGTDFPVELKDVGLKVIPPIILRERIMPGQRLILMKSSRCIYDAVLHGSRGSFEDQAYERPVS